MIIELVYFLINEPNNKDIIIKEPNKKKVRNDKSIENLMIKRRKNISMHLINFFPKDITKMISEYDYYPECKSYIKIERYIL
jgi:hypothetical protein